MRQTGNLTSKMLCCPNFVCFCSEQVDLACDVLALCMTNLSLGESTNRYGVFLERALRHPFPGVKRMALTEIKRNIENEAVLIDLCKRESLLINIIKCLGDQELGVAKEGLNIMKTVALSNVGIQQITKTDILTAFHEIMGINEIVRLRVYEVCFGVPTLFCFSSNQLIFFKFQLIIDISNQSEDNFNKLKAAGLFSEIYNELDNNDILLRLNILELLTKLGSSKHGFNYLNTTDTFKKLAQMLEGDDVVTIQLIEPGILKFFGNVAHWKPEETITKYPNFYNRLFNNLESNDFTIIGVSVDTLGHIGITNNGKIALESGTPIESAIKNICKALPSMPSEVKVRCLNCLENLLQVVEPNNQISAITEGWFKLIDDHPIQFVWNYAKNPFVELRLGGLGVLRAIAGQNWGQEAIRNSPGIVFNFWRIFFSKSVLGLIEFLLDRNIETRKECKEAKFGIVEMLATSDVFDHVTMKRLQKFVKEGPFYVQADTEVAIEGNN